MSFREKIRLQFPFYLVLSVIFSVALWSLWLPKWFGNVDNVDASPITNFSTTVTAATKVPAGSQVKLAYYNGTYAMVFTSSSITTGSPTTTCAFPVNDLGNQSCGLYFTSSTDGGTTWGRPNLVTSTLFYAGNREAISDFTYDVRRGVWVAIFKERIGKGIMQAYSANGVSWTLASIISSNGNTADHYIGRNAAVAFATSSGLRAVLAQKGDYLVVATTSNTGAINWPTSTIMSTIPYKDPNSNDWENIRPIGLSIDAFNNIHAVFAMATSSSAGYEIMYASSTNLGLTWTTSSISGISQVLSSDMTGFELGMNSAATDPYTGRLSILYYQTTAVDMVALGSNRIAVTSSLKYARLGANGVWTTSTVSNAVPNNYAVLASDTQYNLIAPHAAAVSVPYTGTYAGAYFATSSNLYVVSNTSTQVIEQVNSDTVFNMSELSTVYNPTRKEFALAYVKYSDYTVRFTTTSMRLAAVNDFATSTAINPSFASDGSGLVTVTTTITDVNREAVTLYVDYSVDGGLTWSSSTLRTATGEGGSLTTSTGKITGIATSDTDQAITFTWDSLANIPATSTANVKLRVLADDGVSAAGYGYSAAFTVDNLAPGVPTTLSVTAITTSTLTLSWTASTGTPSLYLVSSTAASVTTTESTSKSFSGLSPNTAYLFQVDAQDSYSNTSSFSSATSTYTSSTAPTAVTVSATGETTMTVSWTSSNGTGSVYELYNVTTASVVSTTSQTSYSVTGLTAGTSYQFKVRTQYLGNSSLYSDYSDTSTAVSTDSASSSGSSNSSGGGAAPAAPPTVPPAQPTTPASSASVDLTLNAPVVRRVGASEHTFTALSLNAQNISLRIQSEPITVSLNVGAPKDVDTNNDSIPDLRVTYSGLVQGKPRVIVANLTDENELKNAMTIQAGAYETNSRKVKILFSSDKVTQVALSNTADFAGVAFKNFAKEMVWELTPGNGTKTVYAKLRNAQGGMVSVSDTIVLNASGITMPPKAEEPPVSTPVVTVPTLTRTLKRAISGADVKMMQDRLKKLGFFPNNVVSNSVFGPTTESSVKAFEKANGIKVDGIVDQATWQVMFGDQKSTNSLPSSPSTSSKVNRPNLYLGSNGVLVTELQLKLQTLGYFPKNVLVNGNFGPTTKKSVMVFQKAKGISQTGNVGPLTWEALSK